MKKLYFLLFLSLPILSKAQTFGGYTFESMPYIIDVDSITGCWQIGTPSKPIFDSAHTVTKAIVTDTLNPYPVNAHSSFDVVLPFTGNSVYYALSFTHRFETENGKDGGIIELFDCNTNTWVNIFETVSMTPFCGVHGGQFQGTLPTSTIYDGQTAFSGSSGGWITNTIDFWCMAVRSSSAADTFRLRFTFISDSVETNQDGWMIDDLLFTDMGGFCSGIDENTTSFSIQAFPNPSETQIEFTSQEILEGIEIYGTLGEKIGDAVQLSNNRFVFSTVNLSPGVYVYRMKNANVTGRFTKE